MNEENIEEQLSKIAKELKAIDGSLGCITMLLIIFVVFFFFATH